MSAGWIAAWIAFAFLIGTATPALLALALGLRITFERRK